MQDAQVTKLLVDAETFPLHNANIYSNSKGDNALFVYMLKVVRKCSILLKKKKKKCDFFIRIIIRFKCCFGELH